MENIVVCQILVLSESDIDKLVAYLLDTEVIGEHHVHQWPLLERPLSHQRLLNKLRALVTPAQSLGALYVVRLHTTGWR